MLGDNVAVASSSAFEQGPLGLAIFCVVLQSGGGEARLLVLCRRALSLVGRACFAASFMIRTTLA